MEQKKVHVEEWEQNHINSLTLKMIFAATLGTAVATGIAYTLRASGFGDIKPELLFLPWGIALVFGVSTSFHRGVMAERNRVSKSGGAVANASCAVEDDGATPPKKGGCC